MLIDISSLLRGESGECAVDYLLPIDFTADERPFSLYHVSFPSPAHVTGRVTDNAGYMQLSLSVSVGYTAECARCLSPVAGELEFPYQRTVAADGTLVGDDARSGDSYEDEYIIADEGRIDADGLLREQIALLFPTRLLCREDCKGLCPECGKNLNDGPCGCSLKKTDPRWDVLKSINFGEDGGNTESDNHKK